jgi:beta-N-acetylhexosaminidase
MLRETNVSGVVLFAENLESTQQIIELTNAIQKSAMASASGKPMLISIDQEGGRVARLPEGTPFAGNMAIGATYNEHNIKQASVVSSVIAEELLALGFNNNYAPVIDVNTNPENPVINTRSFGENPLNVAKLGVAVVNGLQDKGIMATLKHFPGHGDTNVDSHLGLPRVDHSIETIKRIDLLPFQYAIDNSEPAMIMTAHIQYPALDSSTFTNKIGETIIKPATMSRKILTNLLRDEMGFNGIIATDALDMAGIAHFYEPVTATVETFLAGSDLALMPYTIRVPSDIDKFKQFIKDVASALKEKINNNEFSLEEIDASVDRINFYKDKYIPFNKQQNKTNEERLIKANAFIHSKANKNLQQVLANQSATIIKNEDNLLPLSLQKIKHIKLIVMDEIEQQALEFAIQQTQLKLEPQTLQSPVVISTIVATSSQESNSNISSSINSNQKADLVIAVVDVKIVSIVDMGATSDVSTEEKRKSEAKATDKVTYKTFVDNQLALAKQQGSYTLIIAKGSPYLIQPHFDNANARILIYDDKSYRNHYAEYESAGFNASIDIILGVLQAEGKLPVSMRSIH